jgi:hypothetical protein
MKNLFFRYIVGWMKEKNDRTDDYEELDIRWKIHTLETFGSKTQIKIMY